MTDADRQLGSCRAEVRSLRADLAREERLRRRTTRLAVAVLIASLAAFALVWLI